MANTIDQQFVEYIVKSLVSKPDAVAINRRIDEKGVLLELTVDPEDLGRVIGKRGATAQSLRTLLRALGTKQDARYNLKIVDSGDGRQHDHGPREEREGHYDDRPSDNDQAEPVQPDDNAQDEPVQPDENDQPDDQPAEEEPETDNSDSPSDRISRTRKELEELDDLDV
jgi:uncharacterized protein